MFKKRNTLIFAGLLIAASVALAGSLTRGATKAPEGPQLAHMVYFKLKDSSPANRAKLAAACKLYLSGHPGTVYFGTGMVAGDLNGQFNDHEFDVSLHLVFANKEALDNYHEHAQHQKFVDENKDKLEKIRVFDSYLSPSLPGAGAVDKGS
jgi:Stress responsive A/B Barrel Domain